MATIIGTGAPDDLTGTAEADTIQGNGGADTLRGGGGNDSLDGGAGADALDGGVGADTLNGGADDDVYYVDNSGDVIVEGAGGGADTVLASVNYSLGLGVQVETLGYRAAPAAAGAPNLTPDLTTAVNITLMGNEFAQTIYGAGGNDVLFGGRNTNPILGDSLVGGAGNDTLVVSNPNDTVVGGAGTADTVFVSVADLEAQGQAIATYTLAAGSGVETLSAQSQQGVQNIRLTGSSDTGETIVGNFGANTLSGGSTVDSATGDTLIGLNGDDTYVITNFADRIAQETGGTDTLTFGRTVNGGTYNVGTTLGADVSIERIELSNGMTNVTGNNVAQTIVGDTAAFVALTGAGTSETLDGGAGADTLIGNGGADTYIVDVAGDVIQGEIAGTGATTDTVLFRGTTGYDLAAGVSVEVMAVANATNGARLSNTAAGAPGVFLVGNEFSQNIIGSNGADILNGDRGTSTNADTLFGGGGNDVYRVYAQSDVVSENTVDAAGTITLVDAGGTNDTIFTSADYSLATNAAADSDGVTGGTQAAGDFIETLSAADQSSSVGLMLTGGANANTIIGAQGNDTINGGAGADRMIGLGGNDTFAVDNAGDVIIEDANGGSDTVNVNILSYTLNAAAAVEIVNLNVGTSTFVGNGFAQRINGSIGGDDITGGGGADTLAGGGGADTYRVSTQDTVIIDSDGLANVIDYTAATGGYDVADGVSITAMTASSATGNVFLVGNNQVQTLTGNAGDNILNGAGGLNAGNGDTLVGGAGNDTYRVFNSNYNGTLTPTGGDVVTETIGNGTDTVFTSANFVLGNFVENLVAADARFQTNLTLIGNGLDNQISGSFGNNVIYGGAGRDTLTGLDGKDTFHFAETGLANADIIADFSSAQGDKISLDATTFAATGGAAGFGGTVDGNEFQLGTAATGNQATILYDQATGRVFFDSDGAGAGTAVLFAQLNPGTALSAADFTLTPGGTIPTPQP